MKIIVQCGCGAIVEQIYTQGDDHAHEYRSGLCQYCSTPDSAGNIGNYSASPHWTEKKPKRQEKVIQNLAHKLDPLPPTQQERKQRRKKR